MMISFMMGVGLGVSFCDLLHQALDGLRIQFREFEGDTRIVFEQFELVTVCGQLTQLVFIRDDTQLFG